MKFRQNFSLACTALLSVSEVLAAEWVSGPNLQNDITEQNLMKNLYELDRIASENGGNRAFGYPGFTASVGYILEQTRRFGRNVDVYVQDFPALFNHVESITFRVGGTSYYIYGLSYSPSTSPEGNTAELVLGPEGDAGCTVEGYEGFDVRDKIVLVQRGTCPTGGTLAGRVRPAAAAGAMNVIIYNNVPTMVTGGTLSAPDPEAFVSCGFINQDDGLALKARLESGERLEAYFQQTQLIEERITQNVFAETKEGDPENVVMLGAHLDSVQAGPGINDDGSGTSLILELLSGLIKYKFANKVRFAWWGAEENGLLGSRYYTTNLNISSVNSILLYLNFDMVSKGYFGVFDGDGSSHGLAGAPGSDTIEKLFVDELTKLGVAVTPAVFTGGSDYASFMTLGKPVGGLHTGTGVEQDPCYHQACDTYANPNSTVLTINAKAAAGVLAKLATEGHELIPKNVTINSRRDFIGASEIQWTVLEGERHTGSCGNDV